MDSSCRTCGTRRTRRTVPLEPVRGGKLELPSRPDRAASGVLPEPGVVHGIDVTIGGDVPLVERVEDVSAELEAVLTHLRARPEQG